MIRAATTWYRERKAGMHEQSHAFEFKKEEGPRREARSERRLLLFPGPPSERERVRARKLLDPRGGAWCVDVFCSAPIDLRRFTEIFLRSEVYYIVCVNAKY